VNPGITGLAQINGACGAKPIYARKKLRRRRIRTFITSTTGRFPLSIFRILFLTIFVRVLNKNRLTSPKPLNTPDELPSLPIRHSQLRVRICRDFSALLVLAPLPVRQGKRPWAGGLWPSVWRWTLLIWVGSALYRTPGAVAYSLEAPTAGNPSRFCWQIGWVLLQGQRLTPSVGTIRSGAGRKTGLGLENDIRAAIQSQSRTRFIRRRPLRLARLWRACFWLTLSISAGSETQPKQFALGNS